MKPLRSRSGRALIERPLHVEASLWRRLRFENEPACREGLFTRFLGFARAVARGEFRRRPPQGLERADFEQLAYGGLLEAIDAFDPLRGPVFEAFARHRIKGAIADGASKSSEDAAQYSYRRRVERERFASLKAPQAGAKQDPLAELAEIAATLAIGLMIDPEAIEANTPAGYDTQAWRDIELSLAREIDRLPETERIIVRQHYLGDVSFTQIASLLGLSKGRVAQIHRAALLRIRERLKAE